jgi:hypothetical protein
MSGSGRVSRIPFEYNGAQLHERGRKALRGRNQVLTSSYRKADAAIIFMEKPCGIYDRHRDEKAVARNPKSESSMPCARVVS